MYRDILRLAVVAMGVSGIAGCAAVEDSQFLQESFWTAKNQLAEDNDQAELGLAELAKGNNVKAHQHFDTALKMVPTDALALYGMALLYQNTGQPTRARELYEQILAIQPPPTDQLLVWAGKETQPVVELANVNVQLLEGGGAGAPAAAPMREPVAGYGAPARASMQPVTMASSPGSKWAPEPAEAEPMFQDEDLNIVARFKALRALLDQGLITQEEFKTRRQMNVGALLPMTSRPPATGLGRAVPPVEQISSRLNAIGRALEMRALTPTQHLAERSMILDALMPERPSSVQNPPAPPRGLMAAADAVRRLEMLKEADMITSDEYTKERAAIEGSMQPAAGPQHSMDQPAGGPQALGGGGHDDVKGFQPGVHLASFRQQKAAEQGWEDIKRRFKSLVGAMQHRIERVDLGGGKGVFYRLKAGPLPSNAAAKSLCGKLKASRQYCEPTTIHFG
ncbi:MAG: SHOCT domain-containing protein [Alphaproteobacteria bacterium]|nr:SHOCT domain-containing protein [Alphaproteobacteria bacterium]